MDVQKNFKIILQADRFIVICPFLANLVFFDAEFL